MVINLLSSCVYGCLSLKLLEKMKSSSRVIMGLISAMVLITVDGVSDVNVAPGSGYLCISECPTCPVIICSPPPPSKPFSTPSRPPPGLLLPPPLLSPPLPPLMISPPPPISLPPASPFPLQSQPPPPPLNKFYNPPPTPTLPPPVNYLFDAPPPPQKPSAPPHPHLPKSPIQPLPTPPTSGSEQPTKGGGSTSTPTSTNPPMITYFYTSKADHMTHPTSFFLQAAALLLAAIGYGLSYNAAAVSRHA